MCLASATFLEVTELTCQPALIRHLVGNLLQLLETTLVIKVLEQLSSSGNISRGQG